VRQARAGVEPCDVDGGDDRHQDGDLGGCVQPEMVPDQHEAGEERGHRRIALRIDERKEQAGGEGGLPGAIALFR
jgi:hypothetical protein